MRGGEKGEEGRGREKRITIRRKQRGEKGLDRKEKKEKDRMEREKED